MNLQRAFKQVAMHTWNNGLYACYEWMHDNTSLQRGNCRHIPL